MSGRLKAHVEYLRGDHEHCNPWLADEIEALEAEVARLREAGLEMIEIVEGINGAMNHGTWRDESALRLKDTPQWVALYLALSAPHSPASAQGVASGTPPTRDSERGR